MLGSIKKQTSKVAALSASLDELEQELEPLLSKPLSDTLSSLDTLQQAKLQVLLPYLVNDLIFIYLKTRGIDPKTHPVVSELDRVRQYFQKIKDAEESGKKRTTEIDKAAAGRFIKHAISEARLGAPATESASNEASPSNPHRPTVPAGAAAEKMKERQEYLRKLAEEEEAEEPVLDIIDDATEENNFSSLKKGKERQETTVVQEAVISGLSTKKRRRPMDPFGSLGEETPPAQDASDKPKKKKKDKMIAAVIDGEVSVSVGSRASSDIDTSKEESKPKKKKSKKKYREHTR